MKGKLGNENWNTVCLVCNKRNINCMCSIDDVNNYIKKLQSQIKKLEEDLLDMLTHYGYNHALGCVQDACKTLNHPINKETGKCFCLQKEKAKATRKIKMEQRTVLINGIKTKVNVPESCFEEV